MDFGQLTDEEQKWCYVIKNMWRLKDSDIPAEETVFRELYENCKISKLNTMEKQEYEKSVLEYEDVKDALEYNRRLAKAEGFNDGFEKGLEKGIEEGIEKGMEKGQEETKHQMVASMLKHGMTIASITGLAEDEIAQLGKGLL